MAKKGHFVLGFVLGAASALATTYLLTPQTSDELKHKVKKASEDIADRAADYFDYAKEASADWRQSATDFVSDMQTKGQTAQEGDLADYDAATEQLRDQLTDIPDVAPASDFDDIVIDGKSAFAQAKDDETASDVLAENATDQTLIAPEAQAKDDDDNTPEA